jgi:hypothetical protein
MATSWPARCRENPCSDGEAVSSSAPVESPQSRFRPGMRCSITGASRRRRPRRLQWALVHHLDRLVVPPGSTAGCCGRVTSARVLPAGSARRCPAMPVASTSTHADRRTRAWTSRKVPARACAPRLSVEPPSGYRPDLESVRLRESRRRRPHRGSLPRRRSAARGKRPIGVSAATSTPGHARSSLLRHGLAR